MCSTGIEKHGANPVDIQWNIVRGDSAKLRIDFLENDETTVFNTEGWLYKATAYDSSGDILDDLPVEISDNYITISVSANTSKNWGTKYSKIVAELPFDIQAFIPVGSGCEDEVWTPVIGTIKVIGDISPGGSL